MVQDMMRRGVHVPAIRCGKNPFVQPLYFLSDTRFSLAVYMKAVTPKATDAAMSTNGRVV